MLKIGVLICIHLAFKCFGEHDPEYFQEFVTQAPTIATRQWVKDNAALLSYLARTPYPLSTWPEKFENGVWHLHKLGIKNQGYNNYIFKIPQTDYWIKISGPKHRVRNIYAYNTGKNSYWYQEIARHWELRNATLLDSFERILTYQTISRYAMFLSLEKALATHQCQYTKIAPTYLVHIPGADSTMCDEHYIIVQKHISELICLRDRPQRINDISNQALQELFYLIRDTGFWNVKNGLYIDSNNNLVLLDYEQRNIENPVEFFFKNIDAFEQCVLHGIQELAHLYLLPHAPQKYKVLLHLIATDRDLYTSNLWAQYIELLAYS